MTADPSHRTPRLHVDTALAPAARVTLPREAGHYLHDVLRLKPGDALRLFNAETGEWEARITEAARRRASCTVVRHLRAPAEDPVCDLWLVFAPVKRAGNEWVIEKATELGITRILPVITRFSQTRRINRARWRTIAREAAEQCERLSVPEIAEPRPLEALLRSWPAGRRLYSCIERTQAPHLGTILRDAPAGPAGLLVGPEGGLADEDRRLLEGLAQATPVSLGPRILRAETAAVFGMSLLVAHRESGG